MSLPLNEQTVLVTGAGRGLGAAIASAFAGQGAKVAINYRRSAAGELADAVLFFASPWGRAVTGQNLIVDGGLVFG